jgi:hypothetical protein
MRLRHDPFPLIFTRGDEATNLVMLQLFDLEESPQAHHCLLELIKQQREDGGFPSQFDAEQWGMRNTIRNAVLLLKAGLPPEGVNVGCAVQFILNHRRPDGGWSENPRLALPAQQTWLSSKRSIVWLGADAVDLLRQVGRGESLACQEALQWLRVTQSTRGGWPSLTPEPGDQEKVTDDPDTTAQVTFLMGEVFGADDPAYLRGRELFEGYVDRCSQDATQGYRIAVRDGSRQPIDVYHLTHLLLSWLLDSPRRIQRGYNTDDPRVRRMMEALIDIQGKDGGWQPFFAEESSPLYTALAVRALVLSGMLKRRDLRPYIEPYALSANP